MRLKVIVPAVALFCWSQLAAANDLDATKAAVMEKVAAKWEMDVRDLRHDAVTISALPQRSDGRTAYHVYGQFTLGWDSPRNPGEVGQMVANRNLCAFAASKCVSGIQHTIYMDVIATRSPSSPNLDVQGEISRDETLQEQQRRLHSLENEGHGPNPPGCKPAIILKYAPAPKFPPSAIEAHRTGTVVLVIFVDSMGLPGTVKVGRSSGFIQLDTVAAEKAHSWKFEPVVCEGTKTPATGYFQVPIKFGP